jgi:hypothetical protein
VRVLLCEDLYEGWLRMDPGTARACSPPPEVARPVSMHRRRIVARAHGLGFRLNTVSMGDAGVGATCRELVIS